MVGVNTPSTALAVASKTEVQIASNKAIKALREIRAMIQSGSITRPNTTDFKKYYAPTDDLWGTPTGQDQGRGFHNLIDYEFLMDKRVGWGDFLTRQISAIAIRNQIEYIDINTGRTTRNETTKDIERWMLRTNFLNFFEAELAFERGFGTAFLVYYWKKQLQKEDFSKLPPNKPPVAFGAFPPTILYPQNLTETGKLDYDKEVWSFHGGLFNQSDIHRDRVHVLCTREVPDDWLGRSIFDPIWLAGMAYLQILQGGVKHLAKWGNMITTFRMQDEHPDKKKYLEYLELVETFKQNYTFVLAQGEQVEVLDTGLSNGLLEFADFVKEDISSGGGISLNRLFGRSESGGIGDGSAITSERADLQTVANIQHDISFPLWKILKRWFDVEDLRPQFKLEMTKTKMGQLQEEAAEIQNDMLKEQFKIIKMQRQMLKEQKDKGLHLDEPDEALVGTAGENNGDFVVRNLNTELPRLIFNTNIKIKGAKY